MGYNPGMKEICVIHMQRAGGHAVCSWLAHGLTVLGNTVAFLNDIGEQYAADRWVAEPGSESEVDWLIYNIEDRTVLDARRRLRQFESIFPISDNRTELVVVRDAPNLFASRLKYEETRVAPTHLGAITPEAVQCWHDHHSRDHVVYHRFLQREYREQLAIKLFGHDLPEPYINRVIRSGGGSSFDLMAKDGLALSMDLTGRWREYADDPSFWVRIGEEALSKSVAMGMVYPVPSCR